MIVKYGRIRRLASADTQVAKRLGLAVLCNGAWRALGAQARPGIASKAMSVAPQDGFGTPMSAKMTSACETFQQA